MLNTVFKKLMTTYFVIIAVTFLVLGLLISQLLGNYYFQRHEKLLLEEGRKINEWVIDYLNGFISRERFNMELQSLERYMNTRIWVLDRRGVIYGVSSNEKEWIGKQITAMEMLDVLKGHVIVKKGIYDEGGKTPMITVGVPILVNGRVDNAIIMHSPLYEVTNTISEVHGIIWKAMAISLLISIGILYIVSKRLASPLRAMGSAAECLAEGDFSQRVEVYTHDEIGSMTKTFNYMAERLETIEENRRSFISAVAHELRSPLTLIKGFVQGIVDGTVAREEQDKYLTIILKETDRLNKLITNLLDLQRMESANYPIHPQSFDINELIRRILIKYEEEIEKNGIQVVLRLVKDKVYVWADRDAVEQVLNNLLDNAIKFMGDPGLLTLETKLVNHKVWIRIEDNGVGISKEDQRVIWDKFFKADKSRDRNKEGTGLGLHIVKKIIEHHGEEICVESESGKGSAFVFSLPLNGKAGTVTD